jgi:hypothetical protein
MLLEKPRERHSWELGRNTSLRSKKGSENQLFTRLNYVVLGVMLASLMIQ